MTTKALTFLVIAAFVLMGAWAQSQSGCAGLVQQGIYDKYSSSSTSSGYSQFVSNFCGNTSQYSNNQSSNASNYANSAQKSSSQSSSTSAGVSVGIFDYNLGAQYSSSHSNDESSDNSNSDSQSASSSQIAILHQLLCDSSDNENAADNVVQQASEFVDPNAIEAYEQCLVQSSAGLQVSTTVYDDQVSISINYVPPIGTPAYTIINDIEISPPGSWNCTGLLWDISQGQFNQTLATEIAEMECIRNVSNSAFNYQGQSLTALPSSIIIMATSGTIIRNFGPLYSSTAKDIISSLAQEIAQLESEFNDISSQIAPQLTEMQTQINTFSANINSLLGNSSSLSDSFEPLAVQVASLNHSTQIDIAATCGNFSIQDDTVFWANCNRYDGTIMASAWDLADCVGVMNDQFICLPGVLPAVSATNELTLDETILTGTLNGVRVSVDLSSFITNRNGRLECECLMDSDAEQND